MAKRTSTFALVLPPRAPGTPAYRWLYEGLRREILAGRLRPGVRLPGTRDLAAQQGLARGTLVAAFEQLKAEGYVEGRVGSGTRVSRMLPEERLHARGAPALAGAPAAVQVPTRLSRYARRVAAFSGLELRASHAFRANLPALDLFPTALWAQVTAQRLRRVSTRLLTGCDPQGYAPLRVAVAEYLATSRGVRCTPEQVVIVSGVQEALDVVTRLCIDPGDRVAVEDPGYVGAWHTFEAAGARLVPVRVDGEGFDPGDRRLRGVRLVYVTPAHQFPLGIAMSLRRRLALLQWARQARASIFEDDYDSEYRYAGRPLPALQGLDHSGVVLFAGSFNKVLFPSLRLGYLVLPPELVERCAAMHSISLRHPALLPQAVLCDFITEGHFARHLRRMRAVYAERLGVLRDAARTQLAGLLEVSDIEAGLQTAGWLADGLDAEAAARAAAVRRVEVTPLARHARGPLARQGLQLGFAAVGVAEIRRGVTELATALEGLRRAQRG